MKDLLDALAVREELHIQTVFLKPCSKSRVWGSHLPAGRWAFAPRGLLERWRYLKSVIHRRSLDVVVYSHTYWELTAWLVRALAVRQGVALVFYNEAPNLSCNPALRWIKRAVLRLFLRPFSAVWATGKLAVQTYRCLLGSEKRIENLGYFINLQPFLGLPHDDSVPCPRFVFLGQFVEGKNPGLLVAAALRVGGDVVVDFYGDGPLRERCVRHALAERARHLRFHGWIRYESRADVFRNAAGLILPSRHDGWGMVVLEALAAGVPVIATQRVAAAVEFVRDTEAGFIIPYGDVETLSAALDQLAARWRTRRVNRERLRALVRPHSPQHGAALVVRYVQEMFREGCVSEEQSGSAQALGAFARSGLRASARNAVLTVLSRVPRWESPPGLTVCVYHFLTPDLAASFSQQLSFFFAEFELVSLDNGLRRLSGGSHTPMLALTFDDGFEQTVEFSSRFLAERGVVATYFIPTVILRSLSEETWQRVARRRFGQSPQFVKPASLAQLQRALSMGHAIQVHGHTHRSYARMPLSEVRLDLEAAVADFGHYLGYTPKALAFPYGEIPSARDFAGLLAAHGIESAFTVQRGTNVNLSARYQLFRHHFEAHWPLAHVRYFLRGRR